jgi:hypothetical protein
LREIKAIEIRRQANLFKTLLLLAAQAFAIKIKLQWQLLLAYNLDPKIIDGV